MAPSRFPPTFGNFTGLFFYRNFANNQLKGSQSLGVPQSPGRGGGVGGGLSRKDDKNSFFMPVLTQPKIYQLFGKD